jgi:phosphotransferase system  glucose/maltose/N-acetylglucosamine-specific IIC component
MFQHIFEALPVLLAILAAVSCSKKYTQVRHHRDRAGLIGAVIASILLTIAQTSWWVASLVEGRLEDTIFANYVWTVFNTIVMLVFINMGVSRKPK